jgi:hypothetical protein
MDIDDNTDDAPGFFTEAEFYCRCRRPPCPARIPPSAMLLSKLNLLRYRLGGPIRVRSGNRCPPWNRQQGGDDKSEHSLLDPASKAFLPCEGVDVEAATSREREHLLCANYAPAPIFRRIGISRESGFIHLGCSTRTEHAQEVLWVYPPKAPPARRRRRTHAPSC